MTWTPFEKTRNSIRLSALYFHSLWHVPSKPTGPCRHMILSLPVFTMVLVYLLPLSSSSTFLSLEPFKQNGTRFPLGPTHAWFSQRLCTSEGGYCHCTLYQDGWRVLLQILASEDLILSLAEHIFLAKMQFPPPFWLLKISHLLWLATLWCSLKIKAWFDSNVSDSCLYCLAFLRSLGKGSHKVVWYDLKGLKRNHETSNTLSVHLFLSWKTFSSEF